MDPEDWADIVGETVAQMAGCVERYGGTVVQFAGDAVLAIFGAPVAHEDDPYRAVRSGLDIIETVGGFNASSVEIEIRGGIHTGLVIVGDVSAGDLSTYTALGDTTNVAARMQSMAEPGTLLVSADTYRLVSNDVTARDLGPVEVKGKAEPIAVYEITSVRDLATRRRGIPGFQSPMVGRDTELARLAELADYAAAGSGRVTAIVGDPGVGKSRLIAELQERAEAMDDARWVVGRSASYDQHRPYHLVASLVLSLVDASASDDPEIIKKAVVEAAEPTFGPENPSTGHLLQLLGLEDGHPDDEPGVLHTYYDTALAGLISGTAAEHAPLFVILEDVHWADPSSTELLSGMLERIQQSPVLLVIVSRPDRQSHGWDVIARADRELGESFTETRLRPLDDGDSRELVANLLEIEALSDDLRRQILSRAEGNPFFIEEVVRMLVDRDLIEEMDGRWVAKGELTTLDVPDTLHGLLASRIDGLPADVRRTAMVAAVIGRRFEKSLLTSVLQSDSDDEDASISADLNVLEAQGMTKLVATHPELAFAFRHALIHDVTYSSMLRKDRRRLHAEVGDAIVRMYPDRLEEHAATLARHYEEAGDHDQELHYLLLAGQAALSRHAMRESHDFYTRASALLDADPQTPIEMKIDVALARVAAGINFTPGDQTIALLEDVRGDAEELGDPDVIARVYALLLKIRTMMEESYADRHYRDLMDRAFALAPTVQTAELRAYLEGMMGQVLRSRDDYAASVELIGGSVAPLEEAGRVGEAGLNAAFTADAEASRGRFDEAERWIERATVLGEESGNPSVIADVNLFKGRIAAARGELEVALEHTRLGIEMAAGASNIQCELVGNFMVADQQLRLGEPASAISHLERTFELGEFCNAVAIVKLGEAWLTSAKANLGDLDPEGFSGPLAMAQAGGSRSGEAAVRLQRAITISASPTPSWPAAFDDYQRAIELLGSIDARPDQARAIHAYANALDAAGRDEESRAQLDAAMAMFDEMGIRPDMVPV